MAVETDAGLQSPGVLHRRRFLNWLLGTATGALAVSALYPIIRYISPPRIPEAMTHEVEAGSTNDPELLEKGFKIVRFGADPVILLKVGESEFRAFTAICTHLDCVVGFRKDKSLIWCNCHNGAYDLSGRNVGGPPPRPLTPLKVHVDSKGAGQPGTVVISKG
jgi:cytochrome b6-f complex iron-sulfur subunit